MDGTYNDHLVQWPDQFGADQKLKHIVKGNVFSFGPLSRKPVKVFDHPLGKETLPHVHSKPPLAHSHVSYH